MRVGCLLFVLVVVVQSMPYNLLVVPKSSELELRLAANANKFNNHNQFSILT